MNFIKLVALVLIVQIAYAQEPKIVIKMEIVIDGRSYGQDDITEVQQPIQIGQIFSIKLTDCCQIHRCSSRWEIKEPLDPRLILLSSSIEKGTIKDPNSPVRRYACVEFYDDHQTFEFKALAAGRIELIFKDKETGTTNIVVVRICSQELKAAIRDTMPPIIWHAWFF